MFFLLSSVRAAGLLSVTALTLCVTHTAAQITQNLLSSQEKVVSAVG